MTAKKTKLHPCNAQINVLLKDRNTRLVVGFLNPDIAVVATEKIETGRGKRHTYVTASYCPFCGKKYPERAPHPASVG